MIQTPDLDPAAVEAVLLAPAVLLRQYLDAGRLDAEVAVELDHALAEMLALLNRFRAADLATVEGVVATGERLQAECDQLRLKLAAAEAGMEIASATIRAMTATDPTAPSDSLAGRLLTAAGTAN